MCKNNIGYNENKTKTPSYKLSIILEKISDVKIKGGEV